MQGRTDYRATGREGRAEETAAMKARPNQRVGKRRRRNTGVETAAERKARL